MFSILRFHGVGERPVLQPYWALSEVKSEVDVFQLVLKSETQIFRIIVFRSLSTCQFEHSA